MHRKQEQRLKLAIIALNRLKITKYDLESCKEINELQRKLEDQLGDRATEIDEIYESNNVE